ncbi:hypothetical protein GOP47_0022106 [Adiantum capillus-veneris]|uniref:Uncharacterized protein n=1 Tax=Adiantum capillus-veneris TaxID=13818 RepID=A0A9D4U8P8_ADICA|nr:hypothetical protein GOP47_0022106 [Adiantum capillus-veneris]
MAKHHPDLIMCHKQPGIAIGRLCEKCDGKCVICVNDIIPDIVLKGLLLLQYNSPKCTQQKKDRDGCFKIVNLGSAKTDLFYGCKKYAFKNR